MNAYTEYQYDYVEHNGGSKLGMLTRQKFVSSIADDLLGEPQERTPRSAGKVNKLTNILLEDGDPRVRCEKGAPHGLSQTQLCALLS